MRDYNDIAFDENEAIKKEEFEELRHCDMCGDYLLHGYYNIDDIWLCQPCAEEWLDRRWEDIIE